MQSEGFPNLYLGFWKGALQFKAISNPNYLFIFTAMDFATETD